MTARAEFVNVLAGDYLERAAHLRKDDEWLATALQDADSLFVPIWRDHNLISRTDSETRAALLTRSDALRHSLLTDDAAFIFLGRFRERSCFACLLEEAPALNETYEFKELRSVIGTLARDEAGLLAYARALSIWRSRHRYCGICGAPTLAKQAGHVMQCSNEACNVQQFPRIDPAIIVLVSDGERALLGRQASWPPGRYSTIAGFVEPGESLEDAVAREVLEETGITLQRITYHSSQPWPFPSSLMLGFMAEARSTDINTGDDELEDAQWFTREDIAQGKCSLPPPISISGCLIADWYNAGAARPLHEELNALSWNTRSTR